MKFYVSITVHQSDGANPDYRQLHALLQDSGFVQRGLDGHRTTEPTSGLYLREDSVLSQEDIEFDLRLALMAFRHRCSFEVTPAMTNAAPAKRHGSGMFAHRFTTAVLDSSYGTLQ